MRSNKTHVFAAAFGMGCALLALLVAAGCKHDPIAAKFSVIAPNSLDTAAYAGSTACRECHETEFVSQSHSRHARTMRPATKSVLGSQIPVSGPIANSAYSVDWRGDNVYFGRSDQPDKATEINYALGSGKDVFTFVGAFSPTGLTEFRMSYIPGTKAWVHTPGQERLINLDQGYVHELGQARSCMACHSMKLQPATMEPDPAFLGVGCESCHGPGLEHVRVAKSGSKELKMRSLLGLNGDQINDVCGRCHRKLDDVTLETEDSSYTARFQGYALAMSSCFQKSGGKLTCITCHTPHEDVNTSPQYYDAICQSCHTNKTAGQKTCSVNSRTGCSGCHMPRRRIVADRQVPITMADHLITRFAGKR